MTPINVLTTELPEAKAKLEIEISPDLVEHSIKHAAEHMAEELKLPGFREGKVPPDLALQKLGHDAVFEHAFNESVGQWYAEALAKTEISPIGDPSLKDPPEYQLGGPVKFVLEVPVRPVAELGDYEGIEVGRREHEIPAGAAERELEMIRDQFGTLVEVDRAAKKGDFADFNFVGKIDGEPFEGGSGSDFVLELGSDQFIPGFEDQLVGAKAGDNVAVEVTFPEDYQAEHLAGHDVVFDVDVNSVKEKQLADLTDEFVSENLGFDTVDALRGEIARRIEAQVLREADRQYRFAVLDAVAKLSTVEIPEGHIHSRAHEIWQELAMSLARQDIDPRKFLEQQNKTEHEFVEGAMGDAELTIRRECTIAALIDIHDLDASEEEMIATISEDINEGEDAAQQQYAVIKESGGLHQLENEVKMRKALEILVQAAKAIPIEQAEAREKMWTPEKGEAEAAAKQSGGEGLWTPGP